MIIDVPNILYKNIKNPLFIYELIDPDTLEVRYIGKTKNIKKRYQSHLYTSKNKRTHKECWINSLIEKGKRPILKVISVTIQKHIDRVEIEEISKRKNLTNLTGGGDGQCSINPLTISKIKLTKNKNKKWKIKKKTKQKEVIGYNILTGKIISFKSTIESRKYGFNSSHIASCCRKANGYKTHKNYVWRYKE